MSELSKKISQIRKEYSTRELLESTINKDPLKQFELWFSEALTAEVDEPNAMTLSTINEQNRPSARIVLLKGLSKGGFTFFTNYLSNKAKQIEKNPFGALTFLWASLERQVRIEGKIEKVTQEESDDYFQNRPMGSRLGAWASVQSAVIKDRSVIEKQMQELTQKYEGKTIERPDFWGGYRLMPDKIEFWQGRPNRLHDRISYTKSGDDWKIERLSP